MYCLRRWLFLFGTVLEIDAEMNSTDKNIHFTVNTAGKNNIINYNKSTYYGFRKLSRS